MQKIADLNEQVNNYLRNGDELKVLEILLYEKEAALESREYMLYTSCLLLLINTYNLLGYYDSTEKVEQEIELFLENDYVPKNMTNTAMYMDTGDNLYKLGIYQIAKRYINKAIDSFFDSPDKDANVLKALLEVSVPMYWTSGDLFKIINLNEKFIEFVGEESYEYHFEVLAASNEIVKAISSMDEIVRDIDLQIKYLTLAYRIILSIPIEDTEVYIIARNVANELEYLDLEKEANDINEKTIKYYKTLLENAEYIEEE